jgi:hypothetical protein
MTMPNFLLVGAAKSGTTSLYHYLRQHPQVYMSPVKEPKFFAFEDGVPSFRGPKPYRVVTDLGAYHALFSAVTDEVAVGEASTYYLYSEKAPERIRYYVSDIKLITILRDPTERAYSDFLNTVRGGREPLSDFARALEAEERRIKDDWWIGHYRRTGFYHEQLARYYELFEAEQIRVYLYEDLKEDPVGMMQDMFRHLGVNDAFVPDTSRVHNASGGPKSRALQTFIQKPNPLKRAIRPFLPERMRRSVQVNLRNRNRAKPPPMPEGVREELAEAYREDILKLQDLIGRDLSSWLKSRRAAGNEFSA